MLSPCPRARDAASALPPQQILFGVPKKDKRGDKYHPFQDCGTVHSHGVDPILNARHLLQGCGLGGVGHHPISLGLYFSLSFHKRPVKSLALLLPTGSQDPPILPKIKDHLPPLPPLLGC